MKTRILIVDAQALERECLALSIVREPDLEVVAHCSSTDDALLVMRQQAVDVLLFSYRVPTFQGYAFLKDARRTPFLGHILIKATEANRRSAEHIASFVSADVFPTTAGITQLLKSIRSAAASQARPKPPTSPTLPSPGSRGFFGANFTAREVFVLKAVIDGLANKEIAGQLNVSESSVKCTVQQLFRKTEVRSRSQLVRKVLETRIDFQMPPDAKIA